MKISLLLFIAILLSFSSLKADNPKIHFYLQDKMNQAADNQLLPVYIIFNQHLSLQDFDFIPYNTPKKERRRIVIEKLQNFSSNVQRETRLYLDMKVSQRTIEKYDVIWMNNTLSLSASPEMINEMVNSFSNIAMICYDQFTPYELLIDINEKLAPFKEAAYQFGNPNPQIGCVLIRANQVWALGNKGQGVLVGNSDDGFQWRHPDVVNQIWQNLGEDANNNGKTININAGMGSTYDTGDLNGIDDDANGFIDDLVGWDFAANTYNITSGSHGTSTMGQVIGNGTNGTTTGVAPDANMMVMRASGESSQWLIFQYAVTNGADVVTSSLSWKWYFNPKPNYSQMRLITDMSLAAGVLHTNSTSNDGGSLGSAPIPLNISTAGNIPAPWRHPDQLKVGNLSGVIGVGNVQASTDLINSSSPYGPATWGNWSLWGTYNHIIAPQHMDYPYSRVDPVEIPDSMGLLKPDVSAPGAGTTSINTSGGYSSFSGTSSATPHTAGACALILSINPELLPGEVDQILELTSVEKGAPGKDPRYGAGRIDVMSATTSPKFTLTGINGGSNMVINTSIVANDTARELAGIKISTNVNPKIGSLKLLKFGMTTNATASHITSFDLYFDADSNGVVSNGDIKIASVPYTSGPITFDDLKFKFIDRNRTLLLAARTTASAGGQTINLGITDTNQVQAYYSTKPFSTNFPFGTVTGISNNINEELVYNLSQNYPNPFNPVTMINYSLARDGHVSIKVFDIIGKEVATIVNGQKTKGNYRVEFDTRDHKNLSSGIYYYRIQAGEFSDVRKMILLK
jgi:subtilisin family serine protease